MLSRIAGYQIRFTCDNCASTLTTDTADFKEALAEMKADGWKSTKTGIIFSHFCPECQK